MWLSCSTYSRIAWRKVSFPNANQVGRTNYQDSLQCHFHQFLLAVYVLLLYNRLLEGKNKEPKLQLGLVLLYHSPQLEGIICHLSRQKPYILSHFFSALEILLPPTVKDFEEQRNLAFRPLLGLSMVLVSH